MHIRFCIRDTIAVLGGWVIALAPAHGDEPKPSVPLAKESGVQQARKSIERGLAFLEKDAIKWRTERGCATCHHGTMTVWALSEAKAQGYTVGAEPLADIVEWTKERFVPRFQGPRDPRPGWSLVSVPAIYLGLMAHNLPILSRAEINQVALHLARHQENDGVWVMPPPANGAPPIWESPETLALLAYLAWEPTTPADPKDAALVKTGRDKAAAWLNATKPTDTTQSATWRLLLDVRAGKNSQQLQPRIDQLFKHQNADGGWSQTKEMPSDGFATGQALYALSWTGAKHDRPEIQRAVAFLVANQKDDGSWAMKSRNHPGIESKREPLRNPVPITYFGSAWASLGLVRTVPSPPDTPAKQQLAFGLIKSFHGKFDVDEKSPDRPVVRVDLRYYEVSDQEVATFVKELQAFPKLRALEFKSAKITDAGLVHLQSLTALQSLSLKDTKVTDAGLEAFRKALPKVKVER